jgi:hypothetical protein
MVDSYKVFKEVSERVLGAGSQGLWAARRAFVQSLVSDESGEVRRENHQQRSKVSRRKSDRAGNVGGHFHVEREPGSDSGELEIAVRGAPSVGSEGNHPYTLRHEYLRPSVRRAADEFRRIISAPIREFRVAWEEVDTSEELQSRLFSFLNEGIVIIENIPRIPTDYEYGSKSFYGFDSEDNGYGYPHFFQFSWHDGVAFSYSFRLLVRWAIQTFHLKRGNHIIWCTNLEYDFGNAMKDWDADFESLDVRWRRGKLAKAVFMYKPAIQGWGNAEEDEKGTLVFWDTLNHWKLGVEAMGKNLSDLFGYDFSKLPKDFYGFKYSAMDAIISRAYALVQRRGYEARGIELKLTPGSTAMDWYLKGKTASGRKFCAETLYGSHTEEELEWLRPSLRGGRTEVFNLQKVQGKVGYFDINSAYPFSMLHPYFPHLRGHTFISGHERIMEAILGNMEGVAECVVDASDVEDFAKHIPYLGTIDKDTGRFVFPLGSWRDKYTFFEIRRALALGYKFRLIDARIYERTRIHPFKDYVEAAYALRLEGAETGDKVLREIGKSLGNNLYGKFGQRLVFSQLDDPGNYDPNDTINMKRLGRSVIIEKDEGYAKHTNIIWGAYITAICRDLLFNHMVAAWRNGNEILYCDTDSIFITGGKWPENDSTRLGALKHEGDLSFFQAILPKTYIYEMDGVRKYKAKGVPSSEQERFIVHGVAEFRKPLKLREALARKNFHKDDVQKGLQPGMSAVNAWVTVHKQLKGEYTKRAVNPDGTTKPLILSSS